MNDWLPHGRLDVRAVYNWATDGYDVYVVLLDPRTDRVTHVATMAMNPVDLGTALPAPSFHVEIHEATRLACRVIETLSKQGLKPESQAKLEGVLEAQKAHLEDMRQLVQAHLLPPQKDSP